MALRATRHRGQRALGFALLLLGAPALAADTPDQLVSFGSMAERDVYLEVSINGVNTSQLLRFHDTHGRLSVSGAALRSLGVDLSAIGMPDAREVSLDAVAGLRYVYNPAAQSVDLVLPDTLRVPYEVNTRGLPATPLATAGRGLVVNYDAYSQTDYDYRLSLYTEQRYFDANGVFSNSGTAYLGGRGDEYVRYDTFWTRSDQETLRTLRLGDTITSSLNWSRSVRVAGVQWGRNFALRPDLVTFPVSSLSASSVVPSSVSLFVNGVQQYSGNVPPGPFVVNQIPGITGAGQATLITRDALGRTVSTSVPLYIDPRMLAAGLSSWSVEAGFVRRQFSVRSFDYDSKPVLTASGRYGYSNDLTLEAHTEAGPGLYNAGAGAMAKLGQLGVVSGSLSGSAGDFSGGQVSLGYQYVRPEFSVDTQATRLVGNYGDLGSREDAPVPRQTERVTVSMPLGRSQSVALSYIGYRMPDVPMAKLGSASYTANLNSRVVLTLSAYKDFSQSNSEGVFLGLSLMLGERTQAGVSVGRQGGQDTYSVNAQSSVPYEGGWGWAVQNGRSGGMQLNQGQIQYLGQYGLVSGLVQDYGGRTQASAQASGSLVLMDGAVIPSRRINDSFALVSTDGTPDVAVLHENRKLGRTNGSGHLLVPDLNAYQTNRISIDPEDLPVDVRLDSTRAVVVPQSGAGVLTTFKVEKYEAASVILTLPGGAFVPVGAEVAHVESGRRSVVGYDGLTFVEDVAATNRVRVRGGGVSCEAEFDYTHADDDPLPTLGPVVCTPLARGQP